MCIESLEYYLPILDLEYCSVQIQIPLLSRILFLSFTVPTLTFYTSSITLINFGIEGNTQNIKLCGQFVLLIQQLMWDFYKQQLDTFIWESIGDGDTTTILGTLTSCLVATIAGGYLNIIGTYVNLYSLQIQLLSVVQLLNHSKYSSIYFVQYSPDSGL